MRPPLFSLIGPRGRFSCCDCPSCRRGAAWAARAGRSWRCGRGRRDRPEGRRNPATGRGPPKPPPPGRGPPNPPPPSRRAPEAATAESATAEPPPAAGARSAGRPRRTVLARPRFADGEVAALKRLRIEALDHFLGRRAVRELHERKAAGPAGLPVHWHHNMRRFGDGCEMGAEVGFACPVRKVPDEQTDCQELPLKAALCRRCLDSIPKASRRHQASREGTAGQRFERAARWRPVRVPVPARPRTADRRAANPTTTSRGRTPAPAGPARRVSPADLLSFTPGLA